MEEQKLNILERYLDDGEDGWREIYINGELVLEGSEFSKGKVAKAILKAMAKLVAVEYRKINVEYTQEGDEYTPPIRVIDGKLRWEEWDSAEPEEL